MEFFKLEQPETHETAPSGTDEGPDLSIPLEEALIPSPRQPLFKQDPLPGNVGGHLSLSAYISQHLEKSVSKEAPAPEPPAYRFGPAVRPQQEAEPGEYRPEGQFLNTLDVDLTAGLEQYMPTPVFRLRVMKKRLDTEIADLRMRINKMERLPNQPRELRENIAVIRRRIRTLEYHEQRVSRQLAALLTMGPFFYGIARRYEALQGWIAEGWAMLAAWVSRILFGPAREQLTQLHSELRTLTEVLDDRIRDNVVTEAEISHLINRYETTLREMEAASVRMQSETFWQRLWKPLRGLVE